MTRSSGGVRTTVDVVTVARRVRCVVSISRPRHAGHTMRVYVPYGRHWFGYSTRRLKENPKIVNSIVNSLLFNR
jgi:hypothetical protein